MKEELVSHKDYLANSGYYCPQNFRKMTFSEASFSRLYILEDRIERIGAEVLEAYQLEQMAESYLRLFRR
jgi:hypothetical protein